MVIQNGGKKLTLTVKAYQYPNEHSKGNDYNYDANWLYIEVQYSDENGVHTYCDPCLLTYELKELTDGFTDVLIGKTPLFLSDFMEPYLRIVLSETPVGITIGVEFTYDTTDGIWKKHRITQALSTKDLQNIISGVRATYLKFPER